jgi:hypothetical protein
LALSGRFTRHGWSFDVYIDFFGVAAAAPKLAAKEEESRSRNDDQKDHKYGHHCCAAAATIVISHKIYPPLRTDNSVFAGGVIVRGAKFKRKNQKREVEV